MTSLSFERSWNLDDIQVLSRAKGGDGRTVEAYAAVFDSPQEIMDVHGHYVESIDRAAFNRTLANNGASRTMVLYNHGYDQSGNSGGLAQVPIGKAIEMTADSHGLRTVTRYNNSDLADSVLESIKNGEITGYSFRGGIYRSSPDGRIPKVKYGAKLPTVTRMELGLKDYGPTPNPAYGGAKILAVRSVSDIANYLESNELDDLERQKLLGLLNTDSSKKDSGAHDSVNDLSVERQRLSLKARILFEGIENHG